MDFSKLRHRIVFLKPTETRLNGMKENIPVYVPIKPTASETPAKVYVTADSDGNAALDAENGGGQLYSLNEAIKHYAVWGSVAPMTGREYDEAQKLREETTYKVVTRYFKDITTDMKILHGLKVLDIVSVLNIGERNTELQIVAKEFDRNGKGEG